MTSFEAHLAEVAKTTKPGAQRFLVPEEMSELDFELAGFRDPRPHQRVSLFGAAPDPETFPMPKWAQTGP